MSDHVNPLRLFLLASFCLPIVASNAEPALREQAIAGMKRAAEFYRANAAAHGGYVYYTSLDLQQRWGEGKATPDQIFIQPPGTPAAGMAFLRAHATTGDGLLAAVLLLEALKRTSRSLADAATVMSSYPQVLVNIRTNERVSNPAAEIEAEMEACESRLGDDGRILVRASGTEPLVRVMVEAAQDSVALSVAGELASALIARFGGQIEGSH